MGALRFLTILVSVLLCIKAGLESRQATSDIDICFREAVDIDAGDSFHVTTSNFGNSYYMGNTDCCLTLQTGDRPAIVSWTFQFMEIEYSRQCTYDYISFRGVPFCGSWAGGYTFSYLVPNRTGFSLGFQTDYSVTYNGFKILVEVRDVGINELIPQPEGGVGSSSKKLLYQQASYSQEYAASYVNTCVANRQLVPSGNNIIIEGPSARST